ncbi:hypothetical protein VULLAG_LOCUS17131 [Vulpes lagopus]
MISSLLGHNLRGQLILRPAHRLRTGPRAPEGPCAGGEGLRASRHGGRRVAGVSRARASGGELLGAFQRRGGGGAGEELSPQPASPRLRRSAPGSSERVHAWKTEQASGQLEYTGP